MLTRRGFVAASLCAVALPAAAQDVPAPGLRRPVPRPVASPAVLLERARLGDARLGFVALDLATGALRASHDPDLPLPPASTLKTVTALYALDRLGPDHHFATRVLRAGDTLVLAGGGDPLLDSDALAMLARETARAAAGWRPARFEVWGGALPRVAEIAPGQAAHLAYNPTISGMMLNFNRVHLGWRCADACALTLEARAARQTPRAYSIRAEVRPGGGGFTHGDAGDGETWQVPRARLGKAGSRWLPVRRPELYAGDVFQTLCRAEGLALPAPVEAATLRTGTEIARYTSPPLTVVLAGMLEHSTNLTAEAVGLAASGAGDLRSSAGAMARWLGGEAVFEDHSGLSAGNRITARGLASMLARADAKTRLRPLLKTDPLRDVLGAEARGDGVGRAPLVAAKTGTLNFVSGLAGYAGTLDGFEVSFAMIAANMARREATAGSELPEGQLAWVKRAKAMQRDLIDGAMRVTPPSTALAEI